ncbi:Arc family DNA-binding protein [Endozoicomonas acroporae]
MTIEVVYAITNHKKTFLVYDTLKESASANRRSINSELINRLC